ncbi:TetR/AcrR family transcriptional regulator [Acetobacter okinawensis]|uniref:TetR/AcrR family transcriptional regulator n=1 Tax=Acetobacter okinawensis TaxID=1076594 RepID=UPI001BA60D22|nr:TetR/AcrR family transcriptional regulator [Acetobacter okinawensis]MBS0966977.1 TetR/AcrR family transcriptional regulator [Acetobacter okinawensis]
MDTKVALLDCAEAALRERGYDGFSYADLAEAVGIRKASIHHHFPTKADLGLALIERYSHTFFAKLDEIAVRNPTGGARLKGYIAACRSALDEGRKLCLCIALCTGRDGLSPPVLVKLDAFHVTVANWLTEAFAAGAADGSIILVTDPVAEAHACLAQMEGAQLIARAAVDVGRFDSATAALSERLL